MYTPRSTTFWKTAFDYPCPFSCDAGWFSRVKAATHTNSSNLFVKRLGIDFLVPVDWLHLFVPCGKMARQWRKRQAFKQTNCFGFAHIYIVWTFLCRSGVAIRGAITVGLWKIFGVVANNKVSVDFAVRKVSSIAIRSLELGNRFVAQC